MFSKAEFILKKSWIFPKVSKDNVWTSFMNALKVVVEKISPTKNILICHQSYHSKVNWAPSSPGTEISKAKHGLPTVPACLYPLPCPAMPGFGSLSAYGNFCFLLLHLTASVLQGVLILRTRLTSRCLLKHQLRLVKVFHNIKTLKSTNRTRMVQSMGTCHFPNKGPQNTGQEEALFTLAE